MNPVFLILTAFDDRQAEAYKYQLWTKERQGALPKEAEFLVISDPADKRVGSGGSSLNVIKELVCLHGEEALSSHILCIHSGGESSRVPQYSALGKVFAPISSDSQATIFSDCLQRFGSILEQLPPGMLVLSGDVLLKMDVSDLCFSEHGVSVLSVPALAKIGTRHGVFCVNGDGIVTEFLHKQPLPVLKSHNAVHDEKVYIDTGAVFFGTDVLQSLYHLLCCNGQINDEKVQKLINPAVRLSLYGDFLYPMAENATWDRYLHEKSEGSSEEAVLAVRKEIWEELHRYRMQLVTDDNGQFIHLGTSEEVLNYMNFALGDSDESLFQIDGGTYVEYSIIHKEAHIGRKCIISQTELTNQTIPDETIVHTLPLKDGTFITRIWGLYDDPKESKWFGLPLPGEKSLWNTPLFVPKDTIIESTDAALEIREAFLEGRFRISDNAVSLADGCRLADMIAVIDWQKHTLLQKEFQKTRERIVSAVSEWPIPERFYHDHAEVRFPLRINFGGGWTDTPPYCLEEGGVVLDAPILLDGICPVHVEAVRLDDPIIILESKDLEERREYVEMEELLLCDTPEDPFSLAKAALIVTGIITERSEESLHDRMRRFGGGLYLNTEAIDVPKGSGLGTSSILGAACIQAILGCFGIPYTKNQLIQWVLCMEQLMSTGGGWQDQAGALSDGLCLISSQPGDDQNLVFRKVLLTEKVQTDLESRLLLIFTGEKRLARGLLRQIMGRYMNHEVEASHILSEFRIIALQMEKALKSKDLRAFGIEMDRHWVLLKQMDPECSNAKIESILAAIEDLICGRMICGAGGGGYLQVLLKPGIKREDVEERLRAVPQPFQDTYCTSITIRKF